MYHAFTSQEMKDFILASFKNPVGSVRILIATIAFGMGVDCKGFYTVIHYYLQGLMITSRKQEEKESLVMPFY